MIVDLSLDFQCLPLLALFDRFDTELYICFFRTQSVGAREERLTQTSKQIKIRSLLAVWINHTFFLLMRAIHKFILSFRQEMYKLLREI